MTTPTTTRTRRSAVTTGDLALLAVGVAGVSVSGPLMAATAAPALAVSFWRNAMALAVLGPLAWRRRRELAALPRRTVALCGLAGGLLALHFATWVPSLTRTSVASATAMVSLGAVWTALLARLDGDVLPRRAWLGMALALVGVLALTGIDASVSPRALTGDLLALAGGFFGSAYVVVGGRVRREASTTAYTTLCYGVAALLLLSACGLGGQQLGGYPAADWWRLVVVTVASQLLGHSVFNRVLRTTSPVVVSLAVLLEVPGAALVAAALLGQVPPVGALAALALILAGMAVVVTG